MTRYVTIDEKVTLENMVRDELLPIFLFMEKRGGEFASRLAKAWFVADQFNQRRIVQAFPEMILDFKEQRESLNAQAGIVC